MLLPVEREQLRADLKRGREYLREVTRELEETREMLEDWPLYEKHCGKNPLRPLTKALVEHQQMAEFLTAWIKRKEHRLSLCRSGEEHRQNKVPESHWATLPARD